MAFDYVPVKPGDSFKAAGYSFDTLKMKHPVETMAICSRDFMLVYTADGAYTASLKSLNIGNNCLVSEATYKDHGKNDLDQHGHMTAEICGTLAESAGIKQLIITHLSDYNDSAGTIKTAGKYFSGEIQMAYPGLEIMFNE
ncbi:MAG TPA: hypothetical protein DCY00_00245 [Actinobacteria bacterium]|nr:hypothetical protein [Actinomycetota bacterium]